MVRLILLHPQTRKKLREWHFSSDHSKIRVGRAKDNDVVLDQFLEVSRHHLELQRVNHSTSEFEWHLSSYGTNGTFLNGMLVTKGSISDQSLIQLAKDGPLLKFYLSLPSLGACTHAGNPPTNLFCNHCGQPLVKQEHFIRQYQILRTLGQGGMGTTYLAWEKSATTSSTKRPQLLVLKEMNADMRQIAKAEELFEREARILKTLNHPGIPKYYNFFVENKKKYLAMELVHGQNLEQRIYQTGPVIPQQAIKWMIQTCDILEYLHSLNPPLVHRDVKPANLMLRNLDQRIVLLDFGAVKEIGTPPGTRIGAEGYSAPEQDRGQPCPQSDLYAIGPTLIFLLTAQAPLTFYRRIGANYQFDLTQVPTITPDLRQVVEQTCQAKLNKRYQTANELSQALAACL